jgi:hypothetical protein
VLRVPGNQIKAVGVLAFFNVVMLFGVMVVLVIRDPDHG